ncbi:MAG: outer rane lipoprotein carrier protein LolA, partial [Proteobacteria bacterium]|nr:outer rane lipoprotein carrier protein LolA [Pseudomonadota bacterium]
GRVTQQASGKMMFARPGKFRWDYVAPYEQVIVSDGVKLWLYDADLDQVTVKSLGDVMAGTIRMGFKGDVLAQMELFDYFGQRTTLNLTRFLRNPVIAPAHFKYTPPKGADIIGD